MGVYLYPSGTKTALKDAYIGIPNPTSITLDKSTINLTTIGQTEQLTATITPTISDHSITWNSNDTSVATVSTSGLVTCVTPGVATITATTVNGLTATCSVTAGRLPSAYQEVEWIASSGTQYINTGFKPNNNSRYLIDFIATGTSAHPIGCYNNPSNYGFLINTGGGTYLVLAHYATTNRNSGSYYNNVRHTYDMNKNKFYVDGTLANTFSSTTFQMNINAFMFDWSYGGSPVGGAGAMKLYSAKIYDNGTLVRDFVPCYRIADTVIGMYDLENDVFYTNSGSGTFTKGPNI